MSDSDTPKTPAVVELRPAGGILDGPAGPDNGRCRLGERGAFRGRGADRHLPPAAVARMLQRTLRRALLSVARAPAEVTAALLDVADDHLALAEEDAAGIDWDRVTRAEAASAVIAAPRLLLQGLTLWRMPVPPGSQRHAHRIAVGVVRLARQLQDAAERRFAEYPDRPSAS